jgi:nitrogen regulatory protein P-II 1
VSSGTFTHCEDPGSLRNPLADYLEAAMRQVIAIVKPFLAEKILEGLRLAPLEAVHVREVKGMGRQKSYLDQYTESEYSEAFLPKVEITAWVENSRAEEVIRKIVELARTGRMGDGKILVLAADTPETLNLG